MMEVTVNSKYRHFKGEVIVVLAIGQNTENLEKMVVYVALSTGKIWIRPYDMFVSKVDREKYPDVAQEYRFEKVIEND